MKVVSAELPELDRLMTDDVQLLVYGEKSKGERTQTWGGSATNGLVVKDMFPKLHLLPPVGQEVCDPPVGGVRYA